MARKKLIQQLKARNPELNQSEIESIIDIFFDGITESLKKASEHHVKNDVLNAGINSISQPILIVMLFIGIFISKYWVTSSLEKQFR